MTDIELLPLPEADDSVENHAQWPIVTVSDVWLQKSVQDYARACVAHATERLKAEIERLRAEVERSQSINSGLCRKSNYYLIDSARWQERAERLAEALQALEPFAEHHDRCGDHDAYNNSPVRTCGCGLDALLERIDALRDHDKEGKDG